MVEPVITDGPFVEGKEVVSGYTEIEVADLDEALRMVRTWPGCPVVEIRPTRVSRSIVDRGELTRPSWPAWCENTLAGWPPSLVRVTGDFATAEDLVQDAVLAALRHWPVEGIPERPDAWLFTVARAAAWTCCAARTITRRSWPNCSGPSSPSRTSGCG